MKFGLIGNPLSHSFSKIYFTEKFRKSGLHAFSYDLLPLVKEDEIFGILRSEFSGLNVTIPYKATIIDYLNDIDPIALEIGAVNTIVRTGSYSWKGFNTDVHGFRESLLQWYGIKVLPAHALVLGSGGSAKAVCYVLRQLGLNVEVVSRRDSGQYQYEDLSSDIIKKHHLIINATPLGMMPDAASSPNIPYHFLTPQHSVFDLVYNPSNTLFLRQSEAMGALTKNGLDMLYRQAEHAWTIWKYYGKF